MALAKTEASGGVSLLPEVLAFSSSLWLDKQLLTEDLVGSLAHVTMLARTGVIPAADAKAIRKGLLDIAAQSKAGTLELPDEEDVHMAVETWLSKNIGASSGLLHSARSRNDQVATDLHLHVREHCARALEGIVALLGDLLTRAHQSKEVLIPSYTHRQRAMPVSLAYWWAAWGAALVRDGELFVHALQQADVLPLGVGAIAGTSLGIDRETTRKLLGFSRLTLNGLDTVGDRDFALDYTYAAARLMVHLGRLSTDVIDFTSQEFGFATLGGEVACGSSMMPQKRNPDVFELLRGKSGRAIGNLTGLFATVKGLPGGYNRDLQEDRAALLETGPLLHSSLSICRVGLAHLTFHPEKTRAGVEDGFTQATDVAEALVKKGLAFREAYKKVGALVRRCQEDGLALSKVPLAVAQKVDPAFDEQVLAAAQPAAAVKAKESEGGTGPRSVERQLAWISDKAQALSKTARDVPRLDALLASLEKEQP
jgi:argininosuccinate lyase